MAFLAITVLPALFLWSAIALLRGSVFLTTSLVLAASICLPTEFFSFDAMGLTWTLDRMWFIVLVVQASIQWCRGKHQFVRMEHCDVAIGMLLVWMLLRTMTQPLGSILPEQPPTLMRLINGYLVPFTFYVILRCTPLDSNKLKPVLYTLFAVGIYLGFTALCEISHAWSLVFPRFISDPDLGIHFGRARGPMLQSVRLGICLITTWVFMTVYSVWLKPDCRGRWVAFVASSGLLFAALFFTYTRSVWLGAAYVVATLLVLGLSGLPRRAALFSLVSCGLLIVCVAGTSLIGFKREYSAEETRESTYMRAAFAYVSLDMFKDRPLAGFGFNQFQVHNPPYLAKRETELRLESIRGYVHHNGFLSILVELGLVGITLYALVMISVARQAWILWQTRNVPQWVRGLALAAVCVGGCHIIQMTFHELSFSTIENGILFAVFGLVVSAKQQFCMRGSAQEPVGQNTEGSRKPSACQVGTRHGS